jgi:lambda family phage tail tape measure protein
MVGVTKGMTPPATIPGSVSAIAANGLAVAKNGIVPYAKGGLVTKPTLFQYKQGGVGSYGLMGEAGTEAIMPLRRGANGKLGVEASGSGVGDVVVNVDAAGSSVEGDGNQAAQLGKAIGIAVQQELVKQKRPGGLLSR